MKKLTDRCFVCNEVTENKFGFVGATICSVDCKEIYFKTDNKEIKSKKYYKHGRGKSDRIGKRC